ncbi:globin domain-containing protein [Sphingobacterium sp. BIGb0165]|uniref:globin domain-containing protein n=1 Tax=Sphingobacterium sp. BIGb0165 TaxID=2940615 RepID=UPI002168DAC3|nr:globin domain-containing protein [Sphingobacterium sp. BIGb0165]MCS4223924.1 hemoglobin-like flavoprotein [Sphingobacterium sp. BIGb0165]
MITETQKDLIKGTIPVLKEHGVALTSHFYKRMFTHSPELKHIFNMGNQQNAKQQTALATAVLAYAEHIDNPSVLLSAVKHIGQKHSSPIFVLNIIRLLASTYWLPSRRYWAMLLQMNSSKHGKLPTFNWPT